MANDDPLSQPDGPLQPARMLVPYVTNYTNRTPTIRPLALTALRVWAVAMLEWSSLRWIDNVPVIVWFGSSVIAAAVPIVLENKEWLDFKNARYFPVSVSVLMSIWIGVVGFAYLNSSSGRLVDPTIEKLQAQLASADRDRDAAIIERDNARRANNTAALPPQPSSPPTLPAEDAQSRIDAWEGIEGQMKDFIRIFGGGEAIVENWKTNQAGLQNRVADFRQQLSIARSRLAQLIGTYPDYSDLKIIDQGALVKLTDVTENLLQATSQLPQNTRASDYEVSVGPYIRPLKRELEQAKQ
jgi:hypothetical protein